MTGKVVVLTGGVGGAKLVRGLTQVVDAENLTVIVNTGDDFHHLGLAVSPDIDTLLYTLSGKANAELGWGRAGESWSFMAALRELGGEDWFSLGDGDLALHVLRTMRLARGDTLSAITQDFASAWGLRCRILPMSDDKVRTHVETDGGWLEFQRYFVEQRCVPAVKSIAFHGAEAARPLDAALHAIASADIILLAPSNPYLSIDPILAVPQMADALAAAQAPVVAVSPIVEGQAVKGPTAKMMGELGWPVSNATIAQHYHGVMDAMLIHTGDAAPDGVISAEENILMQSDADRVRVAKAASALAARVRG